MEESLKKYYELVLKDREYINKYIINCKVENNMFINMKKNIEFSPRLVWRNVDSYDSLKKIANGNKAKNLLAFSEYYGDEICELAFKELKLNFEEMNFEEVNVFFSKEHLQEMTESKNISKQFKECLNIYIEGIAICNELCKYIKKNQMAEESEDEANI